jgi:uncharacterized alpha-E superfamily protein
VFGGDLSASQLADLAERIRESPIDFVAQEHIATYRVPALTGTSLTPRNYHVRSYLVSTGGSQDPYEVMPGGMTRFASADATGPALGRGAPVDGGGGRQVVSLQRGGGSKDTWILSDSPPPRATLLDARSSPLRLTRAGGDLASRVADDLFWLGRYVQRAESATRLLRCVLVRLADPQSEVNPRMFSWLICELTGRTPSRQSVSPFERTGAFDVVSAVFSDADAAGLRSSARRFQSLARTLRDRISIDAWRILQAVHRDIWRFPAPLVSPGDEDEQYLQLAIELSHNLITSFLAFEGMAGESMTRGQGWRFLDLGMRVERSIALARLCRTVLVEDLGDEQPAACEAVLDVADNTLTYRSRYAGRLEVPAVIDLLLADDSIPRGLAYQTVMIEEHLSRLPRTDSLSASPHPRLWADLRLAARLVSLLQAEDLSLACEVSVSGRRERLALLMGQILELLASISEVVGQTFFAHAAIAPTFLGAETATFGEEGGGR